MIFEVPPICHVVRRWYESTGAAGKWSWAERHGRTIETEGFSRDTCGASSELIAEESKLGEPLGGVVTYETQDSHTHCPVRPDPGYVPAGGCSAALYRCFHRRTFLRFEPVLASWLPGSGYPRR